MIIECFDIDPVTGEPLSSPRGVSFGSKDSKFAAEIVSMLIGPPGADSVVPGPPAQTVVHDQVLPSALWTVNHNTGRFPCVVVIDSGGDTVLANVRYPSANTVEIVFAQPSTGIAYVN